MTNEVAPKGAVFVCTHCGKRSYDRYGDRKISRGWDVSCVLHALLCVEETLIMEGDRVTWADPWEKEEVETPPSSS